MKKLLSLLIAITLVLTLAGCGSKEEQKPTPSEPTVPEVAPVVETFKSNYLDATPGHSGQPKNYSWIFEGETTDGIITKLNFDVIQNLGQENEMSLSDIYGYLMNISDIKIDENGKLTITANGYDTRVTGEQFMFTASIDKVTDETKFSDLTISQFGQPVTNEEALIAYSYLAKELGIELTNDTLVKDLLASDKVLAYVDGAFVNDFNKRIGWTGFNGGRTYGEQLQAVEDYILANKMTLEDVEKLFETENQMSTPIAERDTVAGATIAFDINFQNMIYTVLHGELPEYAGEIKQDEQGNTIINHTVTTGFGGAITADVVFDKDGKIVDIKVLEANETPTLGGLLTAENSDYIKQLIEKQDDLDNVETVTGTTVTSKALIQLVTEAKEEFLK